MPNPNERFADRHIGPRPDDIDKMLATIGAASLDDLVAETIPGSILDTDLDLPPALSEGQTIERLRDLASKNVVMTSLIGLGYHDTITPPVIQRNVLESPAWYTAYTPYQPEISQGRLEALLNFQTMVSDLTGLDVANASLLDEATAAAEAMAMCRRLAKSDRSVFYVDDDCHLPTIEVVKTRAEAAGIEIRMLSEGFEADRRLACCSSIRDLRVTSGTTAPWSTRPAEPGRWWPWPPICSPSPCSPHPGSGVPTSRSARPSVSACPWVTAGPIPGSSPPETSTSGASRAVSSACPMTRRVGSPTGLPSRHGSSTYGGRRPPPTSAPRRSSSRSWPASTAAGTGRWSQGDRKGDAPADLVGCRIASRRRI